MAGSRGLGTLVLDLVAKVGGFETDMGRAARIAEQRSKQIEAAVSKSLGGASKSVAGFVAGFATIGAGFAILQNAINQADRIDELSAKFSIGTEQLSRYSYAAKLSGLDLEKLAAAIPKLQRNMASAVEEGSKMDRVFDALGVDVLDPLTKKLRTVDQVLPDIADRISAIENPTIKTALAMELFGKTGADLIEFLDRGGKGIEDLGDRAERLGIVLDSETTASAAAFKDQIDDTLFVLQGLATQIAVELLPSLTELLAVLVDFSTEGSNAAAIAEVISTAFEFAARAGAAVVAVVQGMTSQIIALYKTVEAGQKASFSGGFNFKGASESLRDAGIAQGQANDAGRRFDAAVFGSGSTSPNLNRVPDESGAIDIDKLGGDKNRRDAAAALERRLMGLLGDPGGGKASAGGNAAAKALAEQQRAAEQFADALAKLRGEIGGPLKKAEEEHAAALQKLNELADKGKISATARAEAIALEDAAFERQAAALRDRFADLTAELAGPLQTAARAHTRALQEIEDAGKAASASSAEIAAAKEAEAKAYAKTTAAIQKQLDPTKQLIADMQFELSLIGATDAARSKLSLLRSLDTSATTAQRQEVAALADALQAQSEAMEVVNTISAAGQDAFSSWITGTKSAKEAFRDFIDDTLAQLTRLFVQRAFNNALGSIFGGGTEGGGIFASLLGGYSEGGYTGNGGKLQPAGIVHFGEHVTNAKVVAEPGARQFLDGFNEYGMQFLRGVAGAAMPVRDTRPRAPSHTYNFHYAAPPDTRTQKQTAARIGYESQLEAQRNS